ncbi:uncharacterized protein LOC113345758 isoform X2 [Papaver somniferum]|uniref:uncharacterized protein LOC113345758 isoform X2 n=1 Tax=Papaver somniferum TaxID=3469 RepID=UPI000E6FCC08|nr:uncharacterized protein LOC113345758 isoform X2 [Papaver somniferum]
MNVMRHSIDSSAWKCADNFSPEFSKEPRNVTLGISTDGFNPNGCFGLSHSCWPVIICPYNLPPSMCMKREFAMLCLLISGPRAPGKDIDVYLQPLIEELLQLWNEGVITYDAYSKTEFMMKERLLWAIHDFPALRTLAGCVTHGYYACPTCGEGTLSEYLPFSKKICYMGHRRWLPAKHKYRDDRTHFSGGVVHGSAPWPLTWLQIQEMDANIRTKKGKGKPPSSASLKHKRKAEVGNEVVADVEDQVHDHSLYSRRSILYDVPYWGSNAVRHITDVMHTEKNVTEHLIDTVMGNSKSKDSPSARKDMEAMGINKKLWLKVDEVTGKTTMEDGTFAMTKKEKVAFCIVLKNLKVPSRFSSNLRSSVIIDPLELKNFKSHDYHVVMQHLFLLLVHTATSLPKDLRVALHRISLFFRILCAKVINREHLLREKATLVEAMCVLEKHFPPFFVISIHLMVHLADEALVCGPVRYRWMYPFERLMKGFKGLVRNKRYIDGCIARGYTFREASLYCMEDFSTDGDGTHKHTRQAFLDDDAEFFDEIPLSKAKSIKLTQVQFEQARKWVLSKYVGIEDWQRKYDSYVNNANNTSKSFYFWLRDEVIMAAVEVDENGLPMSRNSTKLGILKGSLVRTHIPISYTNWKMVPENYKDDVWEELQKSYLLPDACKETVIKGMSDPWRRLKWELRITYYDPYPTYEERTARTPPNITDEDWKTFCRNEEDEKVQKNRLDNKRKRENYDYSHTSGRKPHSLVRAELELENPRVEITTSDVWIKDHTQEGGKILRSAQKYYDDLKKAQLDTKEKQDSGSSVDEADPLTVAFGKDTRGRVRAVGAVSRTQYDYSAPACAKVAEMKYKDG